MPAPTPASADRRWNCASWAALLFALFIAGRDLAQYAQLAALPADGWVMDVDSQSAQPSVTLALNYGPTSALAVGDSVLAVNGIPIETVLDTWHRYYAVQAPDWAPGTVLTYTVDRAGQTLTVPVTLARSDLGAALSLSAGPSGLAAGIQFIASPFFFLVSLATFLLRPRQPAAHALLHIGTAFLFQITTTVPSLPWLFFPWTRTGLPWDHWMGAILPGLLYLALAFPAAKWPLRRWPRLIVLGVYLLPELALNTAYVTRLYDRAGYERLAGLIYAVTALTVLVTTVASLIHSARTLRDPVSRSQLKWITVGMLSFVVVGIGGWFAGYLGARLDVVQIIGNAGWFLFPVTLAIAITRYRLFDIDVIIRRTLIYSSLSAVLALVYFGTVVVLEGLLRGATGGDSPIAIVLSTLVIAALSVPLHTRVQRAIDRAFYRRKYDAAKTLAAFGAQARDETDLERLSAQLVGAVEEAMQPAHVALWLRSKRR